MTEPISTLPVLLTWTDNVLKPDFDRLHPNLSAKHAELIGTLRAEAFATLTEELQNPRVSHAAGQRRLPFPLPVRYRSQFVLQPDNLLSPCRNPPCRRMFLSVR